MKLLALFAVVALLSACDLTPREDAFGRIHLTDTSSAYGPFRACTPKYLQGCGGALVDQSVLDAHAAAGRIVWE